MARILWIGFVVLSACGTDGSAVSDGGATDLARSASDGAAFDAAISGSTGCGQPVTPGYSVRTMKIDNVDRSYGVFIPDGVGASEHLPLVFVFHHRDGTIDAARSYGMEGAAKDAGQHAIFVYPQALPYPGEGAVGWEIGCGNYDSRFADAIYTTVAGEHCIDTTRVFATGFSWGADMTIAYGCCRSDLLRAVAPSSGTAWGNWQAACPTQAPALRITIGDADGNYSVSDVQKVTDFYRGRHGCNTTTTAAESPCLGYNGCSAPVVQCIYPGMGHQIPQNGAANIWRFFASF